MSGFEIKDVGDPLSLMSTNRASTVEPMAAAVPFLALPAYIVVGYAVAVVAILAVESALEVHQDFAYKVNVVGE